MGTLVSCNSTVSACVQSLQWHLALRLFETPHGVDLITWLWQHAVEGGGVWGMYRHDFISGVTLFNVNWENEAGCIAMLVFTRGLDRNFKTLVFLPWNIIQLSFHMRAFGSPYPSAEWQVVRSSLSLPRHPQWLGQSNWASPNHVNRPTTCAWPTH